MVDAAVLALAATGAAVAAEAGTAGLVRFLRRRCQWLITARDLNPPIDRAGLERFLAHGWDGYLGWVRKPNTAHDETGQDGRTTRYHIDDTGARLSPGFENRPTVAAAFGDSYTFCRQVNDDKTWPHLLSLNVNARVANRGVGNYGLDQALLRLEREFDHDHAPVVLMGVVPETICRVASVWRHFSEYGNVFAFKPRFTLAETGELQLLPNPVETPEKFLHIAELLPTLKQQDFFFGRKFAPDMMHFPYFWRLWCSRRRNLPLIAAALRDCLGGDGRHAFCRVMDRNIRLTAELYGEPEPLDLLVAITGRFAAFVRSRGARPILVMLPQLYDLKHLRAGNYYYAPFLDRIADKCEVFDLGPVFADDGEDAANYIDDRYGGHFSARGNQVVADHLTPIFLSQAPARRIGQTTLEGNSQ